MGKTYTEFTEVEKQAIYQEVQKTGITQKELAKKHNTGITTIFNILKEERTKVENAKKEETAKKKEENKKDIQDLLKSVDVEDKKEVAVGVTEYQALFKISTEQTEYITKLESKAKALETDLPITIAALNKEASKVIERDKMIDELKNTVIDLDKSNAVKEIKNLMADLIFDGRIDKGVRKEFAMRIIEADK